MIRILSYKKEKNGQYKLTLDNSMTLSLYEEVILKEELLIKKEIDDLDKLLLINQEYDVYYKCLKYISKKNKTVKELSLYMKKLEFPVEMIDRSITLLQKQGYLDDSFYAESYINQKTAISSSGPSKIKDELSKKGIEDSVIVDKLNVFTKELQIEKINNIISKLIKTNRNKSSFQLKNKIINYLIQQGYYIDDIKTCINEFSFSDDKSLMEKEYNKIKKRLSRKYSGTELEYKVKQQMYQKGFNMND